MKVTLIRFPLVAPLGSVNNEPTPPLGLAFLAASLKQVGFDVEGIDATGENLENIKKIPNKKLQYNGLDIDSLIEMIDLDTKVIGISSMFTHEWTYVRECITKLKNNFPSIPIIAGGEHISALPEYSLRDCKSLDYVAIGEGEETIVDFCKQIDKGKSPNQVDGICRLSQNKYVKNSPRRRIKNVDQIPWPDWDVFKIEPYLDNSISFGASFGRNMPIMATRGCPYQCTFCSNLEMWTKRYYMRKPEDVIDEIKYYIEKYKVTGIQFYDLTAIVKKQWIIKFCNKYLENKLSIEWSLPSGTRSEALDEEVLQMLSKTNLRYLVYAPESGSNNMLEKIKKRINLSSMINSVKTAVGNNIGVRTNFIIGFPNETRKDLYKTFMLHLKFAIIGVDDIPLYPFQPYPGTEIFNDLVGRQKIKLNDQYFDSLATLSTGQLSPPDNSYSEHIGRLELYFYRCIGLLLTYSLSYLLRPRRIMRTAKNIIYTKKSATVFEQRLKDILRRKSTQLKFLVHKN